MVSGRSTGITSVLFCLNAETTGEHPLGCAAIICIPDTSPNSELFCISSNPLQIELSIAPLPTGTIN